MMNLKARNELEAYALARYEELAKMGKNPHGELRDILIEMSMREEEE